MWNGLITVQEINLTNEKGEVLWENKNLKNMLHLQGDQFILNALFLGGVTNTYIPSSYYFGLDNRISLAASNTMSNISSGGEPAIHGYSRNAVASVGAFTVSLVSGVYQAQCPILVYSASGGSWGPIRNLFMTNKSDYSGVLISSVALGQIITVSSGNSINLKMGMALKDCP